MLYRFADFRFDPAAGELLRGAQRVRLRPQPCGVLALLLDRPGTFVSRQELHRAIWPPGTHVEYDQGLNSCVRQLRAALGDCRIRPRFIETLNRRGYRFVARVVTDAPTRSFAAVLDEELMLELAQLWAGCFDAALRAGGRAEQAVARSLTEEVRRTLNAVRTQLRLASRVRGGSDDGSREPDRNKRHHAANDARPLRRGPPRPLTS
jgi:DNA-binding winged helix-turn-helix (wHTH) protein